jgi:hypothetical protein
MIASDDEELGLDETEVKFMEVVSSESIPTTTTEQLYEQQQYILSNQNKHRLGNNISCTQCIHKSVRFIAMLLAVVCLGLVAFLILTGNITIETTWPSYQSPQPQPQPQPTPSALSDYEAFWLSFSASSSSSSTEPIGNS